MTIGKEGEKVGNILVQIGLIEAQARVQVVVLTDIMYIVSTPNKAIQNFYFSCAPQEINPFKPFFGVQKLPVQKVESDVFLPQKQILF